MSEKLIFLGDLEKKEKEALEKQKAINKASFLINDAKARYIKEKTRARSKKAAQEKDAILNSGRFDKLNEYARFEDIQFVSGGRINGRGYAYKCGVHNTLTALQNEIRKLRDQCDLSCTDSFNTVLKTINKHLQEVEGK